MKILVFITFLDAHEKCTKKANLLCPQASPQMDRNPSPPPDRDEETGEDEDAIGETVYSKHWLFSTLTRLIQVSTELSEMRSSQRFEM